MHKNDWCEGGLQLVDIDTKNIIDFTAVPYIMIPSLV